MVWNCGGCVYANRTGMVCMAIYMWCNGACWKFQKLCCHSGYCHWDHLGWPWKYDIWGRLKYSWGLPSLMEATKHPWCLYTIDERPGVWMEKVCPVLMRGSPTYPCTKGLPKSCSFSCQTEKCLQSVSPDAPGSRWWPGLPWPFIWATPVFVPGTLKRSFRMSCPLPSHISARVNTWRKIRHALKHLRILGGNLGIWPKTASIKKTSCLRWGTRFHAFSKWIFPWIEKRNSHTLSSQLQWQNFKICWIG